MRTCKRSDSQIQQRCQNTLVRLILSKTLDLNKFWTKINSDLLGWTRHSWKRKNYPTWYIFLNLKKMFAYFVNSNCNIFTVFRKSKAVANPNKKTFHSFGQANKSLYTLLLTGLTFQTITKTIFIKSKWTTILFLLNKKWRSKKSVLINA